MIQVNLLPEEMRRIEHTPLPRFILILSGAVLVVLCCSAWVYLHFNALSAVHDEEARLIEQVARQETRAKEADDLKKDIETLTSRRDTIQELSEGRREWWVLIDELSDIIPYDMWITSLNCGGSSISMGCYVDGDSGTRVAEVWRLFKLHPTFGPKVASFPNPEFSVSPTGETRSGQKLAFSLNITLKPVIEKEEE